MEIQFSQFLIILLIKMFDLNIIMIYNFLISQLSIFNKFHSIPQFSSFRSTFPLIARSSVNYPLINPSRIETHRSLLNQQQNWRIFPGSLKRDSRRQQKFHKRRMVQSWQTCPSVISIPVFPTYPHLPR